jgi:hypothetical protein
MQLALDYYDQHSLCHPSLNGRHPWKNNHATATELLFWIMRTAHKQGHDKKEIQNNILVPLIRSDSRRKIDGKCNDFDPSQMTPLAVAFCLRYDLVARALMHSLRPNELGLLKRDSDGYQSVVYLVSCCDYTLIKDAFIQLKDDKDFKNSCRYALGANVMGCICERPFETEKDELEIVEIFKLFANYINYAINTVLCDTEDSSCGDWSVWHSATFMGNLSLVKHLTQTYLTDINPNTQVTKYKLTALRCIAGSIKHHHIEVIKYMLMDSRLDFSIRDADGFMLVEYIRDRYYYVPNNEKIKPEHKQTTCDLLMTMYRLVVITMQCRGCI